MIYTLRKPTEKELVLLDLLIKNSHLKIDGWSENLLVKSLNDEGMGSIELFPEGKYIFDRKFGKTVSELYIKDIDNIDVLLSLNLDQNKILFELDIWKVNFEPIINLKI